jgi:ankyrin repeat protein
MRMMFWIFLCLIAIISIYAIKVIRRLNFVKLCNFGSLQQINEAIRNGADVNAMSCGITPLMMSASNSNIEVMTILLKAGADVNAKGEAGLTPLMKAVWMDTSPEVITFLFKAGADVNAKGEGGMTPLMWAAKSYYANPEVLITLLKFGADPKARDVLGRMPIYYASENEKLINTEIIQLLEKASR